MWPRSIERIWHTIAPYFERTSFPVWVLAGTAVCGLVYQFVLQQSYREKATELLHSLYLENPVFQQDFVDEEAVRQVVVNERCEFLRDRRHLPLDLNCSRLTEPESRRMSGVNLGTHERKELRERLSEELKSIPVSEPVAFQHFQFFEHVRQCAEHGTCDEDTVRRLFQRDMVSFLNTVCVYVEPGRILDNLRYDIAALAAFVLDGDVEDVLRWSEDDGRENLFFCPYLRDLS